MGTGVITCLSSGIITPPISGRGPILYDANACSFFAVGWKGEVNLPCVYA